MQSDRSFSIVDEDDDFTYNLDEPMANKTEVSRNIFSAKRKPFDNIPQVKSLMINDQSDDSADDISLNQLDQEGEMQMQDKQSHIMALKQTRIPSPGPGPSGRKTVTRLNPPPINQRDIGISSEDSDDSDRSERANKGINNGNNGKSGPTPGEYDPEQFTHLNVNEDVHEVLQYITKYVSQQLTLDLKFRPFIPDFLPSVGDIDAFLKVIHPDHNINGELFAQVPVTKQLGNLGLTVLDEPSANQSDPALLHLQLRAHSVIAAPMQHGNVIVKKVHNVEKESKIVDKWIKDITDLHKTKSSPVVKYSDPMPDLDDLMQQWPEKMENLLKLHGFPSFDSPNMTLTQYIDIVACMFDIPVYRNKIQTLHLLFSLYATVKTFQKNSSVVNRSANVTGNADETGTTDQLVLD